MASSGVSDDEIINDDLISSEQCILWREQYSDIIKKGLKKKEEEEKKATKQFSSPMHSGMITMLTTNIMQLQLFNGTVTRNLMGDAGKTMDNFNKLSNMQLKVMQETRKSIMAINEITNPKRTTFIKEANQHNHLHQNSEKKDDTKNELQKADQLNKSEPFSEAEFIPIKGQIR